jgi:hypothetical protein
MTPRDDRTEPVPGAMSTPARYYAGGMGATLLVLLAIASQLTPDPRGYGTHEQLGVGQCAFIRLWNIGCPSCGMTTSWSHLTRGNLRAAAEANVTGLLLGLYALAAIPWLLASSVRGHWCYLRPRLGVLLPLLAMAATVAVCDWIRRWGWELALDRFPPFG